MSKALSLFLAITILYFATHFILFEVKNYGHREYTRGRIDGMLVYFEDTQKVEMIGKKQMLVYFK